MNPNNSSITYTQDHVSFDLDGTTDDRWVLHHSVEPTSQGDKHRLRLRLPDASTDPALALTDDGNYPDLVQSSTGTWHAVWQTDAKDAILHGYCDPAGSVDCTDLGDWTIDTVEDAGTGLQHAYVATDGDRVFVVYMSDPGSNGRYRVQYKTKCQGASEAWLDLTAQTPCVPTTADHDQSTASGRPALGVDRGDNVVHVGYVQTDDIANAPALTDGEVIVSTTLYEDCP